MENFPRRSQLDKNTPAEITIRKAMDEIEKMPADERLTIAVTKLDEAFNFAADFTDNIPLKMSEPKEEPTTMNWHKITNNLPPFGKRVLFRGITTWRSKWRSKNKISFFDDELTTSEESFDYGISGYILENNSDWAASDDPNIGQVCDQYITHWCEIPTEWP